MRSSVELKKSIVAYARSLGFERVGVTAAVSLEKDQAYLASWLAQGCAGEMDYMEKDPARRGRPADLLPGAKSVIALAMSYYVRTEPSVLSTEGRIARYAWGKDYHKVIGKRLEAFTRYLEALAPEAVVKTFVDTGPLLERAFAQRAGLGFIGKNTMLITKGLGSWVFLASVVTSLELPVDAPDERSCGECRLCIDACPTDALTDPYQLDARRCIAYLTIEHEGPIAPELRGQMGEWIFGCDICQDVCPHNTRVPATAVAEFSAPGFKNGFPALAEILAIRSDEDFKNQFAGTPLMRTGRQGLIRSASLAAAHLNRTDLIPLLEKLCSDDHEHPLVREDTAWAMQQLQEVIV